MLSIGSHLPDTKLHRLGRDGHETVTFPQLSAGKRVAVFAVPGAFTPTCSKSHLPGFLSKEFHLRQTGIDLIACLSTADFYVMDAWANANFVGDRIMMLSDGDGEFTRDTGMMVDFSGHGFGVRSKRYAMVVSNGTVETLLVETDPMVARESSAEALLSAIA